MDKQIWSTVKAFFSAKRKWQKITRQEYLTDPLITSAFPRSYRLDVYRLYLTKAGYLERVENGVYVRVKRIPKNLTTKQVFRQAYPHLYLGLSQGSKTQLGL